MLNLNRYCNTVFQSFKRILILLSVIVFSFVLGCTETKEIQAYSIPESALILDTSVAEAYGNADAVVTIISDDGFLESGLYLNELMKYFDLHASVAGVVDYIKPNLSYWKEIVDEEHVEVINHSYNHKTMNEGSSISSNYFSLKHQIVDSDMYYEKTFGEEQIVFIWPENAMCNKGYTIMRDNGFWASRSDIRGFNSLSPEDGNQPGQWYQLCMFGIKDDGVDTSVRNAWIDQAIAEKGWVIEMWHAVLPEDDGLFQTITLEDAAEHLYYLSSKVNTGEVWNPTFTDAVKYIREKQNSNIYAYILDGKLHIYVELTNPEMSYETFDYPLTVGVYLPNNNEITYYNAIPGEEMIFELDG